jgi:hypothetical protein
MLVYSTRKQARAGDNNMYLSDMSFLPEGNYIVKMVGKDLLLNYKVIKINN